MADSGHRATIIVAIIGMIGSIVVAIIANWDKFSGGMKNADTVSIQNPAPAPPTKSAIPSEEGKVSIVNISGSWLDPINPVNGSQITQSGSSFRFNNWGVLPNGISYKSTGSGTVTGRKVTSSYTATYQNGWISQGNCSGSVSGDGSTLTSTCTDSVLGTFVTSGMRN